MKLQSLICFWLSLLVVSNCRCQETESLEVRIIQARENVNLARSKLDTAKKLFELNATSKRDLRKAQYGLDKSTLELAILTDPNKKQDNLILLSKIKLRYSTANRKMYEQLRESEAASEYEVERAIFQEDTARLWLKYHQSQGDTRTMNFLVFKIAAIKAGFLKAEYDRMEPLYLRGSISKARFDSLAARVKAAVAARDQAREAMGATAKAILK